ncbi:MAG TPA: hypothetical protein VFJ58_29890 [Armatimonadota bacterium]|nr:hypothetical protein [Armatimonadota bacterium]
MKRSYRYYLTSAALAALALMPFAIAAGRSPARPHASRATAHVSHSSAHVSHSPRVAAKTAHKSAAHRICRYCGMRMSTLPNEMAPRRKLIGGKIYYCCAACGPHQVTREMPQSMARACLTSAKHR